jgi:CRISPR system Cascade subunit CasE
MNLFVSVLELDRRAIVDLAITDPYSLHRVVYSCFDDARSQDEKARGESRGFLYADEGGDARYRRILMLSDREPSPPSSPAGVDLRTSPLPEDFLDLEAFVFKVTVNPTRCNAATGKREAIRGREAVREWFIERAKGGWGFTPDPDSLQVNGIEVLRFTGKNGHQITQGQAKLQGVLRVTDRDRFIESVAKGIGRARSFGCGMLQIRPITTNCPSKEDSP